MPEINKVQLLIRRFAYETKDVVADDKTAAEWLRAFRNKLIYQDMITDSMPFAEALLKEALDFNEKQRQKANARWKDKNSDAEQAGGAVDSNTITHTTAALPANHQPPANVIVALSSRKSTKPVRIPNTTELYDFAHLEGIDDSLAREWYDMTISRNWCDREGNKIKNWQAACRSYVSTRIQKLSQQEG